MGNLHGINDAIKVMLFDVINKFNALWRQYDSLVILPNCICENSKKLKKHNQLLKLMQFLMGLDEVYAPIRSIILTTDHIPHVKGAFTTLSRDAFRRIQEAYNPHLLCTHCNMNGHTDDRCFELVRYPPNFKKRYGANQGGASDAGVLVVLDYQVSLLSVHKLSKDNKFRVIFDENVCIIQDSVLKTQVRTCSESNGLYFLNIGTENTGFTRRDEDGHPDDSESAEVVSVVEENSILQESDKESEGDDSYYQVFNDLFQPVSDNISRQDSVNLRRSSRKASMPTKLSDFHIETKMEAMNLEMEALNRNNTWAISKLPYGRKAKGCKWVYKVKYKSTGEVERFKARLVAKGYNQEEGIDYEETFSPVVKIVTVRCILALSVQNSWPRKYCLELLFEFGMLACKPCKTPIEVKTSNVKKNVVIFDKPLVGVNNYQKLIRKLIYLTHTRPDISYVVHVLSQYMHAPMQSHLKLAFGVLRYLKNSPGKGITFNKSSGMDLNIYVDSDWAKCKVTRKGVSGYSVFLGNSLANWKSKKESVLAKYSTKAEYRALNLVTCEVIWIMKILNELNVKVSLPVTINYDNSSEIQIAANPVFHERTKHFEIELFFLREKVVAGIVKIVKVKSEDNVVDVFT
ncbi:ribonuclease H-like domain-containing protein [Tanacetum coccineum]|uniref:Ribonuclease H-like domain-containing protein n=1 Tax=Tanacetum coccineum TaxID=301880 RepID=A0ABQ5DMV8_9ASTR